jgi:hypothetical protein
VKRLEKVEFELVFTKTEGQYIVISITGNVIEHYIDSPRYRSSLDDDECLIIERASDPLEDDERVKGHYIAEVCDHEFEFFESTQGMPLTVDMCKDCGLKKNIVFKEGFTIVTDGKLPTWYKHAAA